MLISPDREIGIGACLLAVGVVVLGLAYGASGRPEIEGYDLIARFNKADGIGVGSEVRLSGSTIGKVVAQELDDRFRAVVTIRLPAVIALPIDSAAMIQTDGLLGAKFIALQPGGDDSTLRSGQEFSYTQDAVNVRDLLELIIDQGQAKHRGADSSQPKP